MQIKRTTTISAATGLVSLLAALALVASSSGSSKPRVGASSPLPPQLAAELKVPEHWFAPQVVQPGARAINTRGQRPEDANPCSFPFRFWGYDNLTPTTLANGDVRVHIIRVISYQSMSGQRTAFETDNFHVLIYHTHPLKNWKITGRFGEQFLNRKLVWLESGLLSATPLPSGGETVVDPHPTRLSTKPDLCKLLRS
jgi:hypothetical protein